MSVALRLTQILRAPASAICSMRLIQSLNGALLTGAQLGDDGTARCDFDLPDVDNDRLRALAQSL